LSEVENSYLLSAERCSDATNDQHQMSAAHGVGCSEAKTVTNERPLVIQWRKARCTSPGGVGEGGAGIDIHFGARLTSANVDRGFGRCYVSA
jgi:hypothetical protein